MIDRLVESDGGRAADLILAIFYFVLVIILFALWVAYARAGAISWGLLCLLLGGACLCGAWRHYRAAFPRRTS